MIRIDITPEAVQKFAEATGDWNPIHFDDDAARRAGLPGRCAHGLWIAGEAARQVQAGRRIRRLTARFERPALVGTFLYLQVVEGEVGFRWVATAETGERLATGEIVVSP